MQRKRDLACLSAGSRSHKTVRQCDPLTHINLLHKFNEHAETYATHNNVCRYTRHGRCHKKQDCELIHGEECEVKQLPARSCYLPSLSCLIPMATTSAQHFCLGSNTHLNLLVMNTCKRLTRDPHRGSCIVHHAPLSLIIIN